MKSGSNPVSQLAATTAVVVPTEKTADDILDFSTIFLNELEVIIDSYHEIDTKAMLGTSHDTNPGQPNCAVTFFSATAHTKASIDKNVRKQLHAYIVAGASTAVQAVLEAKPYLALEQGSLTDARGT